MRLRLVFGVFLLAFLGGGVTFAQPAATSDTTMQQRRPIPYPITLDQPFRQAIEEGTRTRSGTPGPNYWTNTATYDLAATVDPDANVLRGRGTIQYQNNSPDTLRQLVVHLRQNIHKEGGIRNRPAEITGGMTLDRLDLGGADTLRQVQSRRQLQQLGQGYVVQDTRLIIFPPERLMPDSTATLNLDWHFQIPGADNFRMGQDGEVYFLAYWYPHMAVYDDVRGWTAQPYQGDGEFYMGYADYDLSITVPEGWLVGATGALQNPDDVLTDSVRARLDRARRTGDIVSVVDTSERGVGTATVAASEGDSTLTWQFSAEQVRDVAFGTSDDFVWDATTAETGQGTSMIHSFYRPEKTTWQRSAEFARFSVEHLSDMLIPYPYPHMTAVEGPIGGGMEFPMITHIGDPTSDEALFGVTYHEISHEWFPMIVGTNEKAYAWFDEGTTTFNETEGRDDFFPDTDAWAS
ncbi:MAG TPA: M1 family metallopeptidase [Salinibacter sp.]|nr:M1 family metallopeptidase [Salinibacter sp.]